MWKVGRKCFGGFLGVHKVGSLLVVVDSSVGVSAGRVRNGSEGGAEGSPGEVGGVSEVPPREESSGSSPVRSTRSTPDISFSAATISSLKVAVRSLVVSVNPKKVFATTAIGSVASESAMERSFTGETRE